MKKLFVIVPAIALVLFLINAFVLKEKVARAKTTEKNISAQAYIVFKSLDGGQTWQDISKGLPKPVKDNRGISKNVFFTDEKGLYLTAGKEIYQSKPSSKTSFWTKEISIDKLSSAAPPKSGIFTYKYWGVNLKTTSGISVWSPIFENDQEPRIRSVFETAGGTIFIGTNRGLFKTINNGKTWKHVHGGDMVGNLAESNGVLLATGGRKIIRSTDNGENWAVITGTDGVAFDVKQIKGGFAAITASSELNTRVLSTSNNGGKTWQLVDTGFHNKAVNDSLWRTWNNRPRMQATMTLITQMGENFFCTHPDGIFKSSDQGKTWKLLLPSVKNKAFNLIVSGNVLYAIAGERGC